MAPRETNELLEGEEEKARTELDERVREDYQPEDLVKKYCNSGNPDYSRDQMAEQLTDRAMRKLDGINMERFLREVENKDIAVAIKMLSGDAVTHIFSAMSPDLARMIAEAVEYMGPVRVKDVESSCMILLKALVRLADAGDITLEDAGAYKLFVELFQDSAPTDKQDQLTGGDLEKEDYELLKEFGTEDTYLDGLLGKKDEE